MGNPVTGPEAAGADARGPGRARVAGVVLFVDPASGEPPFRQLMSQIVEATRRGVLTPGTRLPAVRTLAEDVGISTATAAKVYRELEDGGVLEGRGRSGTFIAETDAAAAALARAAELFADRAAAAGAGVEDAVDAVRTAFAHRA